METSNNIKIKILVSAYACQPHGSLKWSGQGEMILGWNIVNQIAKYNEAFVLTHADNKSDIQKELDDNFVENLHFYYINLSEKLRFLLNFEGGIHLYAYLWQIKAYFFAKRLNKKIHFDVFHHITYANDWMASYIGVLLSIPYIRGPGGGAHYVPWAFAKEYPFRERMAQQIRSIGQWIFRHDPIFIMGQNRAKALLVCNKEAFNILPKKWQKKTYFFPVNGISKADLGILLQKENSEDVFLILSAGKLIKIKSFDLVIKAFAIFNHTIPESKLVIIGDGPELKNLEKLVTKLHMEGKVIFEQWMKRQELMKKIALIDVFLFLSLRDGGGAVVVEAMAQGKPVVCFDIGGPGFHIKDEWGIKIKPENTEQAINDTAKALEEIYKNKELRKKLGKKARERAMYFYDWDVLGEKLEKIYQKVFC